MVRLKNKAWVWVVMRHDFDGKDCVIAVSSSDIRADELMGEYSQMFTDKGISEEESYFYLVQTLIYT